MRACLVAVCLAASACTLPDEHDPGDFTLYLTVDASAAGPIDGVVVFAGDQPIAIGGELPTAPISPAMLATGEPAPTNVRIFAGEGVYFDQRTWPGGSEATLTTSYGYDSLAQYGAVIGLHGGVPVAAGELHGGIAPSNEADSHVTVAVQPTTAEVWGDGCMRLVAGAETHYVVLLGDYDCDGIFSPDDCKPTTYCDRTATSGPAHDACVCN